MKEEDKAEPTILGLIGKGTNLSEMLHLRQQEDHKHSTIRICILVAGFVALTVVTSIKDNQRSNELQGQRACIEVLEDKLQDLYYDLGKEW